MNIEIKQTLPAGVFKKAIATHYFSYKYTWINPILGLSLIVLFIIIHLRFPELFDPVNLIMVVMGLYLMSRPLLFVQKVYSAAKTNKTFDHEISIQLTDDTITTSDGANHSTFQLRDLYAYLDRENLLFIYLSKNQYFIIQKELLSSSDLKDISEKLHTLGVKKR